MAMNTLIWKCWGKMEVDDVEPPKTSENAPVEAVAVDPADGGESGDS